MAPEQLLPLDSAQMGRLHRTIRKQRGLTLNDMYVATGLTPRFLSEFERGRPNVSMAKALRAFEALGMAVLVLPREDAAWVSKELSRRSRTEP